jgi:hypothetical protein
MDFGRSPGTPPTRFPFPIAAVSAGFPVHRLAKHGRPESLEFFSDVG